MRLNILLLSVPVVNLYVAGTGFFLNTKAITIMIDGDVLEAYC